MARGGPGARHRDHRHSADHLRGPDRAGGARQADRRCAIPRYATRSGVTAERNLIVPEQSRRDIAPAQGKLGVLLVGLGAVSTTFIAGVENVRRGRSRPIGSLSQLASIRLGKRTENRAPKISDFVPLSGLNDLVFAAWDPIPGEPYT